MRSRILLMYITVRSGHYQAARALEQGVRLLHPAAEILTIDAFQYLNPVLARMVDRLYMSVIQRVPELWDYLYDNPKVVRRSTGFRRLLHRYDSPRLRGLLEEFEPHVVACTQAFPCGLVADYKSAHGLSVPLYGVITDFSPHAYWLHEQVDGYIVPTEQTGQWLKDRQVEPDRIFPLGIPIHPRFGEEADVGQIRRLLQIEADLPTVLLMGGRQGLGPILESVELLGRIPTPLQLLVVAGSNESLYHRLITLSPRLNHRLQVFGHVDFIPELMSVSSMVITKPGGLTTSEALAKGVPIVAINPIPGQETRNARFLVGQGAACLTEEVIHLPQIVRRLLGSPEELKRLADNARRLGRPHSACEAARLLLDASGS